MKTKAHDDQVDARRYRWLRENGGEPIYIIAPLHKQREGHPILQLAQTERLDSIVDAAIERATEATLRRGARDNAQRK